MPSSSSLSALDHKAQDPFGKQEHRGDYRKLAPPLPSQFFLSTSFPAGCFLRTVTFFFPRQNVTFGDCWVRKAGGPNLNCHFFFSRVFEDDGNFWLFSFFFFFFFPHFLLLLLLLVSTTSSLSWSLLRLLLDWPALVIYPGVMFGQCKLHNSGNTRTHGYPASCSYNVGILRRDLFRPRMSQLLDKGFRSYILLWLPCVLHE